MTKPAKSKRKRAIGKNLAPATIALRFAEFWLAWPRKFGKLSAEYQFERLACIPGFEFEDLMTAARAAPKINRQGSHQKASSFLYCYYLAKFSRVA